MKHTKAPWTPSFNGVYYDILSPSGAKLGDVCASKFQGKSGGELGLANARRIAACVNACEGLSTEDLESRGLASVVFRKEPEGSEND